MAQRRRLDEIDRKIELEIRRGVDDVKSYRSKIRDIKGTNITVISPMLNAQRPRTLEVGDPLILKEDTRGAVPHSYRVSVGLDMDNPDKLHQYKDPDSDEWMLILEQSEDLPVRRRELVRARMTFPLMITLADSGREYGEKAEVKSIDLSGSGIHVLLNLDDISEIPRNTKVILSFREAVETPLMSLPPIKGTVVRAYKYGEALRLYALGIKFDPFEKIDRTSRRGRKQNQERQRVPSDKDQSIMMRYVLKKQIENQALRRDEETR